MYTIRVLCADTFHNALEACLVGGRAGAVGDFGRHEERDAERHNLWFHGLAQAR